MTMRLSNQQLHASTLNDLQNISNQLFNTQRKMSSGKEITKPSDDPFGTTRALTYRRDLDDITQTQSNVDDAMSWQTVTGTALQDITSVVQRAHELLIQGGNDSNGPTEREDIAKEIDQLVDSAKSAANANYGGRYVFSGTATDTKPYITGGADTYQGDTGNIVRTIGPGVSIAVNATGDNVLGSGGGDGKLLDTLRNIATHLRSGLPADQDALRNGDITALDTNLDQVNSANATIGAQTNRLTTAKARLSELEENSTSQLSNVENADMADVLTSYSLQQAVYQSALKAGANIVQTSLMDFLR
jgi:flagellar hook-associated protein 3 FlgL